MNNLETYYNNQKIIQETAEQLSKDFAMAGLDISFHQLPINSYEELFSQAQPHIRNLLLKHTVQLYNLLYRIDISEEMIRARMKKNQDFYADEILTELIIQRELQKVVLRTIHKGN